MDIKDRVSKLLALAGSPNEHEAKAAILKARELMVKYKLRPEEFEDEPRKAMKVVKRETNVTCTKMTGPWIPPLAATIAENYCCKSFRRHKSGAKASSVGFIGMEDDLGVCEEIFRYAVDCVKSESARLIVGLSVSASRRRELTNTFGFGFCEGLKDSFKKQTEEHQEWGLVLVTPTEVQSLADAIGKPQIYAAATCASRTVARAGYAAGLKFDPHSRLRGEGEESQRLPSDNLP